MVRMRAMPGHFGSGNALGINGNVSTVLGSLMDMTLGNLLGSGCTEGIILRGLWRPQDEISEEI